MTMLLRHLVFVAATVAVVTACTSGVAVDGDDVVIDCDAQDSRCPGGLVCIVDVGRCLDPRGPCIADDGVSARDDGATCTSNDGVAGACFAGTCTPARCGDGRVDRNAGEVCDDGDDNRPGWAPEPGCLDDCSGAAPFCADGLVSAEEACDDGFRDACGSCNADCSAFGAGAFCGDAVVCAELETCDDGGATDVCNGDCTLASCGDGRINAVTGEVCDDGDANSDAWGPSPHCNASCTGAARACGDGVVDPEEVCDDPVQSLVCERTCQAPVCGDGVTNTLLGEACDDGGASARCTAECQPMKLLAVGFGHTCVVDDGVVRCFGNNSDGQCGADNPPVVGAPLSTMGGNLRPLPIEGDVAGVVAGLRFTCAFTTDGRVACFGENRLGQTGSGAPYVDTGGPVVDLAAGRSHVCALRDDGTVVCWGENRLCQAGAGHDRETVGTNAAELGPALVPVDLQAGRVTSLGAGEFYTCARFADGRLQCWGSGADGALGLGDVADRGCVVGEIASQPFIDLPAPVASLSVGGRHVCALLTTRQVLCWGFNGDGRLGQGIVTPLGAADFRRGSGPLQMGEFIPTTPLGPVPVRRLSPSGTGGHTCALFDDGGLGCWGDNSSGELGLEDTRSRGVSTREMGLALPRVDLGIGAVVIDVSVGANRTCARLADGDLACWGQHTSGGGVGEVVGGGLGRPRAFPVGDSPGEMGDGLLRVPLTAACGNGIVESGEACDDGFRDGCGSCNADCSAAGAGAVCGDGQRCVQLERCDPGLDADCSPACVPCGAGRCLPVCAADVCGDGLVCEGREVCDPTGLAGADCDGTCSALQPSLHAGLQATCHLDDTGAVRCFGSLQDEQLGREVLLDVTDARDALPIDFGAVRRAQLLRRSVFGRSSCVLLSDGSAACWGDNASGQLGTGDLLDRGQNAATMGDTMTRVALGTAFTPVDIAVGGQHVCALSTTGLLKCWGNNGSGRLGQGAAVAVIGQSPAELGNALPPIRLGVGVVATAISAGLEHTCILDGGGRVRCWGEGDDGRLGSGNVVDRGADVVALSAGIAPVDLGTTSLGAQRLAKKVVAGRATTCAIVEPRTLDGDDELVCWGSSFVGQLGIGRPSFETPIGDSPTELGDALVAVDFGGPEPKDVCLSFAHTCVVLDTGGVRCWGSNTNGQLGFARSEVPGQGLIGDDPGEVAAFADVPLPGPADAVTCGDSYNCARLVDGRFSCWGQGRNGALGLGEQTEVVGTAAQPLPVLPLSTSSR